jgi:hypothetical protein
MAKKNTKETLESKIITVLTSNRFCRKKPNEKEKKETETVIKSFIEKSRPLLLVVLFGGYKNPSTGLINPDLAEIKTLERLNTLLDKVREIYPHGVELYIITTGKKGEIANGISPEKTSVYERKISDIAKNFKGIKVIPIGLLYHKFYNNGNLENMLKREKNEQMKLPETMEQLAEKIKIAKKHNSLPLNAADKVNKEKAIESAITYSILSSIEPKIMESEFHEFIKLSFRVKGEKNALSLFTCKKGTIHQPWNNSCTRCIHKNRCFAE